MGQCMSKKHIAKMTVAPLSSEEIKELLIEKRNEAVEMIHKTHMVSLSCRYGLETCIIKDNKRGAEVIIKKQAYLKDKIRKLQELIKVIDESADNIGVRMSKKNSLLAEATDLLNENNEILLNDNVSNIVNNDRKVVKIIESKLKPMSISSSDIKIEMKSVFMNKSWSQGVTSLHRRRYSKKNRRAA